MIKMRDINLLILCYFASSVAGHAYFSYPLPRNVYCSNASCTTNGALSYQGPLWSLPTNSLLKDVSPISQTKCDGSVVKFNATLGNTYDPGFQGKTAVSWLAGSTQTVKIFISQIHVQENQTLYPTDGWRILYRDGNQSNSIFSPIPFTYKNALYPISGNPAPAGGFELGETISVRITVPSNVTNDGIFQFFWRNNGIGGGVMWLSCIDVTITAFGTQLIPSKFSIAFASLLILIISALYK